MARVTSNLWWKLGSLLAAVILWFVIVGDPELTTTISVPVEYRKAKSELEIASEVPQRVQLEISGPSGRLSAITPNRTPVVLDLSSVHEAGERTFTIDAGNVQLPNGVVLQRAIPSQLRLNLERRTAREVPVQIRYAGPPPAGYRVATAQAFPDRLLVVGPESHVARVAFVETDPVKLADALGVTSSLVHCFVADPLVSLNDPQPVTVRVEVEKVPAPPAPEK